MNKKPSSLKTIPLFLLMISCGGGSDPAPVSPDPINQSPTVNVNNEQIFQEGQAVSITATANDNDGTIASFLWSQSSGISANLETENTSTLNFNAPLVDQNEILVFEVLVTDNDGATGSNSVSINVNANISVITDELNDTGVTLCGDYALDGGSNQHSNAEDCSENFDGDFDPIPPGQDGNLGADFNGSDIDGHAGFSFTKLDENGNDLLAGAIEWSCVKDEITGMIWEVKSVVGGLQDTENTYTWFNTDTLNNGGDSGTQNDGSCAQSDCDTSGYVDAINEIGLCGGNDWELPTLEQLSSIVDYSVLEPDMSIDENYFPNTQRVYWTSSAEANRTIGAWVISFIGGGSHSGSSKNQENSVRLVRKGQ